MPEVKDFENRVSASVSKDMFLKKELFQNKKAEENLWAQKIYLREREINL